MARIKAKKGAKNSAKMNKAKALRPVKPLGVAPVSETISFNYGGTNFHYIPQK